MKRPLLPTLFIVAATCWAAAASFILIDPLDLYPWGMPVRLKADGDYSMQATPYLAEVVAKTADIDTVFLGTSTGRFYTKRMMEDILPNTHHAFNLSYGNPASADRKEVAQALLRHSRARRFIIEADWTYILPKDEQRSAQSFPLYLYDDLWWNDIRAVNRQALRLSLAVLRQQPLWLPAWSRRAEEEGFQRRYDSLHTAAALAEFKQSVSNRQVGIDVPSDLTCSSMTAVGGDLAPFVAALSARGAEVDIVMPIYAWILYYWSADTGQRGLSRPSLLNDQLKLRNCIVESLGQLPGVRVFAFDDVPGLAADNRNYCDPVHMCNPAANRFVLQSIAAGTHRLTEVNIAAENAQMRQAVTSYGFIDDKLWTPDEH